MKVLNIVCATDGHYLRHCAAMLTSLKLYGSVDQELRVYLIIDNVDSETFAKAIPFLDALIPSLSILKASIEPVRSFPVNGHASVATYFRLLLPQILPSEVERVIFIDTDTIVRSPLLPLWQLDLEGKSLAATPDHWLSCQGHGYVHGEYFNAGVMLIDVKRWRQIDVLGMGGEFARRNPHRLRHWDQDVLNHVFKNDWKPVGERWNACPHLFGLLPGFSLDSRDLSLSEQEAIADPAIIHFAGPGPVKPWNAQCTHPLRNLYRQATKMTPWADHPLDDRPDPMWKSLWKQGIFQSKCLVKRLIRGGD